MAPTREQWADAYACQGRSDWGIYQQLAGNPVIAACHSLHYLQMACEKIAKAYRWRDTSTDEHSLTHGHVAFSKFIQSFLGSPSIRRDYIGRAELLGNLTRLCRKLAREVEKLAPSVARENSPENAEYPWEQGESVIVPCEYAYPSLSLLGEPGGRTFLKLVSRAFDEYEKVRTH
jgi:hypothetical protein